MVKGKIIIIEKHHAEYPEFAAALTKKGLDVVARRSGKAALEAVPAEQPQAVIVNAAALRSSGALICQRIKQAHPELPLLLLLPPGHKPKETPADVVLNLPFTAQKIVNRLKHYLNGEADHLLRAGILKVDKANRRVKCLDKESRLTPRLLQLLTVLIEHRGEPVTRSDLFKAVWNTEYVEDMRTLDVHISWLRKAIEPDPRHPRFLKTVRGVGYLLDV